MLAAHLTKYSMWFVPVFEKPNRTNANQPASTKASYLSWIAKANYTCVTYKLVICEWFFHSTWCFRISSQNLIKYTKASVQVCIQRITTTSSFNWNELQTSKTWKIASKWKRIRKKNVGKKHQTQHEMQSLFRLHFFPSTVQVTRREEKKLDGASLVATKMKAMLGGLLVHTQLQAHQLHFISLFAMFDYRLRP